MENQTTWESDVYRDTVTFRYIELAMCAIEAAFTLEPSLIGKYEQWIEKNQDNSTTDPLSVKRFKLPQEGRADVTAMTNEGEFLVQFQTTDFAVLVSLVYDLMKMDIQAAHIVRFEGDMMKSVIWAEQIRADWDDQLVDLQGSNG